MRVARAGWLRPILLLVLAALTVVRLYLILLPQWAAVVGVATAAALMRLVEAEALAVGRLTA